MGLAVKGGCCLWRKRRGLGKRMVPVVEEVYFYFSIGYFIHCMNDDCFSSNEIYKKTIGQHLINMKNTSATPLCYVDPHRKNNKIKLLTASISPNTRKARWRMSTTDLNILCSRMRLLNFQCNNPSYWWGRNARLSALPEMDSNSSIHFAFHRISSSSKYTSVIN